MRNENEFFEDEFDGYDDEDSIAEDEFEEYSEEEYSEEGINFEQLEQTYKDALNNEDYFDDHVEYFDEYVENFSIGGNVKNNRSDEENEYFDEDEYNEEYGDDDEGGLGIAGKIAIGLGIAVVVLAIVTVIALLVAKNRALKGPESQVVYHEELIGVGASLSEIETIGKSGLDLAIEARKNEMHSLNSSNQVVELPEEEEVEEGYEEAEIENDVTIKFETISILKDLKIKLINKTSGRLIANIPFEVTVTYPNGSTKTWADDDRDGIIYTKELDEGTYSIHLVALEGDRYKDYTLPDDIKADVKGKIEYAAVDVADEILDASKVDESKEDTNRDTSDTGNEQGATLTNTVEWVESSVTDVYVEVDKSRIQLAVPVASLDGNIFMARVASVGEYSLNLSDSSVSLNAGDTKDITVTLATFAETDVTTLVSSDTTVATVSSYSSGKFTITAVGAGSATISITADAGAGNSVTENVLVTVTEAPTGSITFGTVSDVKVGEAKAVSVSLPSGLTKSDITVTSGNTAIATAVLSDDSTLMVTGVAVGLATITLSNSDSTISNFITVNIIAQPVTQSIAIGTLSSIVAGATGTTTVTLGGGLTKDGVSVTSSAAGVATAAMTNDSTLTVTGVAAGTATITLTSKTDASVTASITVTVTRPTTGILLSSTSASVYNGRTITIAATLTNLTKDKVTVSSSNTGVATAVLTNDSTLTVTGVAAGSATISLVDSMDSSVSASITITVVGSSEKLMADGEQVYICENGTYREATYADYAGNTTFYKKTKKYAGWQTLNGNTYYYKADGNYVTGEQVINGMLYNFDSTGAQVVGDGVLGIDVSKYQGRIDWTKVKAAGISYVIIRIGYRGYTQGSLIDDSMFRTNIEGAIAAGLKVGVYWVTQAINEVEAVEEASAVISRISGYRISYPVFLDVERSGGRADAIDKQTRTDVCRAFCQTIQNAGYTAGVYANKNWLTNYIDPSQLSGYKIWVAQYYTSCTYTGSYAMWQYSDKGSIDGISGNVDLNMSYLGY